MFTADQIKLFNDTERTLYDYILLNPSEISHIKITDLSKAAHISTTSIIRFCQKIGFSGFSEFKARWRLYLESQYTKLPEDSIGASISALINMRAAKIDEEIAKAAEAISQADEVIFTGIGTSGILAKYAYRYLLSLGVFSSYINDPFFPTKTLFHQNTAFVIFSVSGENADILKYVDAMRAAGGPLIAVTNFSSNSLSRMCDHVLSYRVDSKFLNWSNITSQVPAMYIIEALCQQVYHLALAPK